MGTHGRGGRYPSVVGDRVRNQPLWSWRPKFVKLERHLRKHGSLVAIAILLVACGSGAIPTADLPRTTDQNISITMVESVETLPLTGCHTLWMTRNQEPPPGACEQTSTVRRFVARLDTETVETGVVGNLTFDPLYAMQLASRNLTDGVSVVVMPPPNATLVRLIDSSGEVVDRVAASGGLVALAVSVPTSTFKPSPPTGRSSPSAHPTV